MNAPYLHHIPEELKEREQWVIWKVIKDRKVKDDPGRKVPFDALTGQAASSTDPSTWCTYDVCERGLREDIGLGFVFSPDDPYVGIDLDDCITDGKVADWAQELVQLIDSYTEVSPSGTGIKIWVKGTIPRAITIGKKKKGETAVAGRRKVEVYSQGRYFTVTGEVLSSRLAYPQIPERQEQLDQLYALLRPAKADEVPEFTTGPRPALDNLEYQGYLQEWAERKVKWALATMASAVDGEKHNTRLSMGRLLGGLIPHGLATASELLEALYGANVPKDGAQRSERRAILDGIEMGASKELPLPAQPPQPHFDAHGFACCPAHGKRLRMSDTRGWYCPTPVPATDFGFCNFWWAGYSYDEPAEPAPAPSSSSEPGEEGGDEPGFLVHPETGEQLQLPDGYYQMTGTIWRKGGRSDIPVYRGALSVIAAGVDIASNRESFEVRFVGHRGRDLRIIAPRDVLARGQGCINQLSGPGAAVHERNSKDVAQYLVEFYHANRERLPYRAYAAKLGVAGDGVILPAGSAGFTHDIRYHNPHRPQVQVGTNRAIQREVLTTVAREWGLCPVFWLLHGFTAASPAIRRLRLRRNPVSYITSPSGSGKTTTVQNAISLYGDPTRQPLRIEAGATTKVGQLQQLDENGGVPLFIDEAHTTDKPAVLEALAYQFANGQARTYGSPDGGPKGGELLGGALLFAGEAIAEFRHAGAQRRIIFIEGELAPPLGEGTIGEPGSKANALGAHRAALLESSWDDGAGLLGLDLNRRIWDDWSGFQTQCERWQANPVLENTQAWRAPLGAAAAALVYLFQELGIDDPPDLQELLTHWAAILLTGHETTDPATEAWENLTTLLAQSVVEEPKEDSNWKIARIGTETIAWRLVTEDTWRVMTKTKQFKERVGEAAAQLYGRAWIQRRLVQPYRDGKATWPDKGPGGFQSRTLRIPVGALGGD